MDKMRQCSAWNGMKTMTGSQDEGNRGVALNGFNSDNHPAHEGNGFLRFDKHDLTAQMEEIRGKTTASPAFDIDVKRVTNLFVHTKTTSSGPDNICGQVLKTCADHLCGIFQYIFKQSLKLKQLWKHSIIVPVTKSKT